LNRMFSDDVVFRPLYGKSNKLLTLNCLGTLIFSFMCLLEIIRAFKALSSSNSSSIFFSFLIQWFPFHTQFRVYRFIGFLRMGTAPHAYPTKPCCYFSVWFGGNLFPSGAYWHIGSVSDGPFFLIRTSRLFRASTAGSIMIPPTSQDSFLPNS
jgi:hypothetical protein